MEFFAIIAIIVVVYLIRSNNKGKNLWKDTIRFYMMNGFDENRIANIICNAKGLIFKEFSLKTIADAFMHSVAIEIASSATRNSPAPNLKRDLINVLSIIKSDDDLIQMFYSGYIKTIKVINNYTSEYISEEYLDVEYFTKEIGYFIKDIA